MAQVGVITFATDRLGGGVHVGRHHLETADGKPEGESCCRKADTLALGLESVAMEDGFVKGIEPSPPQEQVGQLQVGAENHPGDRKGQNNQVGEAAIPHDLTDGKER